MNEGRVTLTGNVVTELRHVKTDDGVHIASFRLACTPRRKDKRTQQWVDGDTSYFTVTCWRHLAQNVAASVHRGDPLVVTGDLKVREWTNDGRSGINVEVDAVSVGHDLNRGVAQFQRVSRARPVSPEDDEARQLAAAVADDEIVGVDPLTGEIVPTTPRDGDDRVPEEQAA
ncbi:MAG: single-stranded DNA-binding protein [Actinomycetota bacterium]|nr:single-stranded DNA-binding protein [Actinomycetota bacterium]